MRDTITCALHGGEWGDTHCAAHDHGAGTEAYSRPHGVCKGGCVQPAARHCLQAIDSVIYDLLEACVCGPLGHLLSSGIITSITNSCVSIFLEVRVCQNRGLAHLQPSPRTCMSIISVLMHVTY